MISRSIGTLPALLLALPLAAFAADPPAAPATAVPDRRLAEAARKEDTPAIRTLLRQKADVNGTLIDGSTALHWVVQAEDVDTVDLLLQSGASANAQNRYGVTPL